MENIQKKLRNAFLASTVAVGGSFSFVGKAEAGETIYEPETRPYTVRGTEFEKARESGSATALIEKLRTGAFCPEITDQGVIACLNKVGFIDEVMAGLQAGGYPAALLGELKADLEKYRDLHNDAGRPHPDVEVSSESVMWAMLGRYKTGERAGEVQVLGLGDEEVAMKTPVVQGETGRVTYPGWRVSSQETEINGRRVRLSVIIMEECGNPMIIAEYLSPVPSKEALPPCPERSILMEGITGRERGTSLRTVLVFRSDAEVIKPEDLPEACYVPVKPCSECETSSEEWAKRSVQNHVRGVRRRDLVAIQNNVVFNHQGGKDVEITMPSFAAVQESNGSITYRKIEDASWMFVCLQFDTDRGRVCGAFVTEPSDFENEKRQYVQKMEGDKEIETPEWTFMRCDDVDEYIQKVMR